MYHFVDRYFNVATTRVIESFHIQNTRFRWYQLYGYWQISAASSDVTWNELNRSTSFQSNFKIGIKYAENSFKPDTSYSFQYRIYTESQKVSPYSVKLTRIIAPCGFENISRYGRFTICMCKCNLYKDCSHTRSCQQCVHWHLAHMRCVCLSVCACRLHVLYAWSVFTFRRAWNHCAKAHYLHVWRQRKIYYSTLLWKCFH